MKVAPVSCKHPPEYRRSELPGLDVTISARYHWSVARQLTPFSTTSSESQESYLTTGMLPYKHSSFFPPSHGSVMLPPLQPRVFARLARWQSTLYIQEQVAGKICIHFSQFSETLSCKYVSIMLALCLMLQI